MVESQKFDGYRPQCRVFAAELTADGTASTGNLVEIPFQVITYNNSSDLGGKAISITMMNPGTVFTTTVGEIPPGLKGGEATAGHIMNVEKYLDDVYKNYSDTIYYANPAIRDVPIGSRYNAAFKITAYGINDDALKVTTMSTGSDFGGLNNSFILGKMQRIWIAVHTDTLGKSGKDKYSIIAGVITGFGETYDVNGSAIWTINCKGLSRFLELTPVHQNYALNDLNKTLFNEITQNMIKPVILDEGKAMDNILANFSIPSMMMYPVWVANACFTQMGLNNDYDLISGIRFIQSSGMFNYELLWQFDDPINIPPRQDIIKAQYEADKGSYTLVDDPLMVWASGMRNAIYNDAEYHLYNLNGRIGDDGNIEILGKLLFTNPSMVKVADLIPRIYYDPLITKMLDPKATLSIFNKRIRSAFKLIGTSTMSGAEVFNKIASTLLAVCREDDFGNIILEIPKHWLAPYKGGSYNLNIKYKDFWESQNMPKGDMELHDEDYIIDKMAMKGYSRTEDEGNIITHVEAPASPNWFSVNENLTQMAYVGRISINDSDNPALKDYLLNMQSRYGLRIFTAPPLNTDGTSTNLGTDKNNDKDLQAMLNKYAESMLYLRNFAQKSQTIQYQLYHWLDCNRTLFMPERNEIWLIANKSMTYSAKGSVSFSMTCAYGHAVGEQIGYPFLDMYIYSKLNNPSAIIDVAQQAEKEAQNKATEVQPYKMSLVKDPSEPYWPFILQASKDYNVDADLIKAVMWRESNFDEKAQSKAKNPAMGLMQLQQATFNDMVAQSKGKIKNDIWEPEANTRAGTLYLRKMLTKFNGIAKLALVAYNAGPGNAVKYCNEWGVVFNKTQYNRDPVVKMPMTTNSVGQEVGSWPISTINYTVQRSNSESREYVKKVAQKYLDYSGYVLDYKNFSV